MLGGTGDTLDASTAKKHLFPAACSNHTILRQPVNNLTGQKSNLSSEDEAYRHQVPQNMGCIGRRQSEYHIPV
jgi:hypothetical protein